MDVPESVGDDRPFKINFGSESISKLLSEKIADKLKEFIGDYTDETLVEYVLVLLRNGKSKDETRKELDVFLGDNCVSFVSWLWDHLYSNLSLYTESKESSSDEMAKTNPNDQSGKHNSQVEYTYGIIKKDSETEREKVSKVSGSRHNREWKGVVQEEGNPFPLRNTLTKILRSEKSSSRSNFKRSPSPKPRIVRKQSRENDQPVERDAASHPVIGATRRLLQFAVRDAVRTVQQVSSKIEPAPKKRLRSVVSTSIQDSLLEERPQKLRSVARVLKAAAEAAEDVTKGRHGGSVFDRLNGANAANKAINKQSLNLEEDVLEDGEYGNPDRIRGSDRAEFSQRSEYDGDFTGERKILERDTEMAVDSSENDGYNKDGGVGEQGVHVAQSVSSANKDKNSFTLQYEEPTSSAAAKTSSKIVNISVNVNTWKPPHYQVPRDVSEPDNQVSVDERDMSAGTTKPLQLEENNTTITQKEVARPDAQKEPKKTITSAPGSYTSSRPSDDVDSRTVFVSNVHFGTTKDILSRHFNKFGEVLKVIIVNDATTGQPKGSAYVEFLRKESAESALALNGTSFMSRILKVVRKSSMHHETAAMMGWPRSRSSPFASRLSRVPLMRGVHPGAFRGRLPLKGARSLQWKRENSSSTQTTADATVKTTTRSSSTISAANVPSPTGRNLTYIRPHSKVEASSGGM